MTQTITTQTDAQTFVESVRCSDCNMENAEVKSTIFPRECASCGATGCACLLVEDVHQGDTFWCTGCYPACGCSYCTGD